MTDLEKLQRDIDGIRQSIKQSWVEIATKSMSREERQRTRKEIDYLIADLKDLLHQLDMHNA